MLKLVSCGRGTCNLSELASGDSTPENDKQL